MRPTYWTVPAPSFKTYTELFLVVDFSAAFSAIAVVTAATVEAPATTIAPVATLAAVATAPLETPPIMPPDATTKAGATAPKVTTIAETAATTTAVTATVSNILLSLGQLPDKSDMLRGLLMQ